MEGLAVLNTSPSTKKGKATKPIRGKNNTEKEAKRNSCKGRKKSSVQPCEAEVLNFAEGNERIASSPELVKEKRTRAKQDKGKSNERTKDSNKGCEDAVINSAKENERITSLNVQPYVAVELIQGGLSKHLNALSPRASEKNESFKTSDCEPDEICSYNEDRCSEAEAVGLISGGVSKLNLNFGLIDQKMKERRRVASYKSKKQVYAPLPSFQDLSDANRVMYLSHLFDGFLFNYTMLSYRGLYRIDSGQWYPNENIDNSLNDDEVVQELNELFLDSDFVNQYNKYDTAIFKLLRGDESRALKLLLELVNSGIEPAYYALALVVFKGISKKYNIYDGKDILFEEEDSHNIKTAIKLLKRADQMSPANYFLLGIMKRCNIGKSDHFVKEVLHDNLIRVVNTARCLGLLKLEPSALSTISFSGELRNEECGLGMRKKVEILEQMSNYSLYEIAQDVLSQKKFSSHVLNSLFAAMPKTFSEGLYGYGLALLQGKIGGNFQENIKKAKKCLSRAVSLGHEGAKFLLGVLPLTVKTWSNLTNNEVKRCISELEDYIKYSDDSCFMNKENVDKVTFYLALEYSKTDSDLVQYQPEWAKEMLRLRGLQKRLNDLRPKSQFLVEESVLLSKSKINFAPKLTSTGIRRHNSSSGVETMQSMDLPNSCSSSTVTENGIVFGSTEHSTFHDKQQKRREMNRARSESSGWHRV